MMSSFQLTLIAIMALFALGLLVPALAALIDLTAQGAFRRCEREARQAGVEEAFMARINSRAEIGQSLESVIRSWGAANINRFLSEAKSGAKLPW